jgi:hypothetical protein
MHATEDVYYTSLAGECGPQDVLATLGYANLAKVFHAAGDAAGCSSCGDAVVAIWGRCLQQSMLGCLEDGRPLPDDTPPAVRELPVGRLQLVEVVEMLQVGRRGAVLLSAPSCGGRRDA